MSGTPVLDCIVIGYNDPDFRAFAQKQKAMQSRSGAYHETNSMIRNGERISCMDYLNGILERSTGRNPGLNVFEAPSPAVCYLTSFLKQRDFHVEFVNFFNFFRSRTHLDRRGRAARAVHRWRPLTAQQSRASTAPLCSPPAMRTRVA